MFGNTVNTGIRITRDVTTNAASSPIAIDGSLEESPTYNQDQILDSQEFIEPIEGESKKAILTQYGLEEGTYYMLFLPSGTTNIKDFDTVEFNESGLYQNTNFDTGTTDFIRLKIRKILKGAFTAGRLECLCKKE